MVVEHLRQQIGRVLGLDASLGIDEGQGLFDLGMDSLMAVELKNRLEASLGRTLPATLAFDYPTLRGLADFLVNQLFPGVPASASEPEADAPSARLLNEIRGLSDDQLEALIDTELDSLIGGQGIDSEDGLR